MSYYGKLWGRWGRRYSDQYRNEQINYLAKVIHRRENRMLVGLSGMGVSNLMRCLVVQQARVEQIARSIQNKPIAITFVHVGCEELTEQTPVQLYRRIAHDLCQQGVATVPEQADTFEWLRLCILEMSGDDWLRTVIILDTFATLAPIVDGAFYQSLKGLTNHNKSVCWFFAASAETQPLIDPDNILVGGRVTVPGWLNKRDFADAIREEGERIGRIFTVPEAQRLTELLGGSPGFLRAVSSAVEDEGIDLTEPTQHIIEQLLEREDVMSRCARLWNSIPAVYREVLGEWVVDLPISRPHLRWLKRFHLLKNDQLFSPLFQQFILSQLPNHIEKAKPSLTPIILQHNTYGICKNGIKVIEVGSVYKGRQEIHVSPKELRLIACLKQEPRIFSMNEIADYVYCEDIGEIPNYLITNLVRQVRDRLGNNAYIINHRGRGYSFAHTE